MKKIFTFFFTIIALVSFSQIQNENGKLILETNDTIVGSITYYDDFSSTVTYTDGNKNNSNSCTIDCINEIVLDNGVRYTTIDYPKHKNGKVFVQKIITSNLINLYASEENGSVYYYVLKNNTVYKLENNYVIVEKDDKKYSRWDYKYMGSLKMIMSDKPELFNQIDKLKLNEKDIIEIILEYNNGDINYLMTTNTAQSKAISNWVIFGQYSHFGTYYLSEPAYDQSYGFFIGGQVYFSKNRRHSFKFSMGYSQYEVKRDYNNGGYLNYTEKTKLNVYNLGFTYEYVFFMTQRTNIYGLFHIGDLSYVNEDTYENQKIDMRNYFKPMIRLSPGIGLEYKTKKRLSFYCEFNHLLNSSYILSNFSIGLKYDIGKTTRNSKN